MLFVAMFFLAILSLLTAIVSVIRMLWAEHRLKIILRELEFTTRSLNTMLRHDREFRGRVKYQRLPHARVGRGRGG